MKPGRERVVDDTVMTWAHRLVWAICLGVYMTVFIGGILAGGSELVTLGRAIGFTLVAAVLARIGLALLDGATLPVEQGRLADEEGPLGSLVEPVSSTNVAEQVEGAEVA